MPDIRGWWLVCAALACAAPPLPSTPPPSTPPARTDPVVSYGWEPLRPAHHADLIAPTVRDAAACDAAAEAASAAGVLDVAAYWRGEAHAVAPTPARAQARTAARVEAGLTDPIITPAALAPDLAGRLRTAVERHAWDEVLALALPALASRPHHELYLWAGDALWQQGHEVAARRMWSRARVLLRAAGVPLRPSLPLTREPITQVGWTADGLAFARGGTRPWLEVWDDRLERPWRRWRVAQGDRYAWSSAAIAVAHGATLTLHDPASGVAVATTQTLPDNILTITAASQAPVFAVGATAGVIKVWRWSPGLPLELIALDRPPEFAPITSTSKSLRRVPVDRSRTGRWPLLAVDPQGTRLAFQRRGQPVELLALPSGTPRRVALPDHAWSSLRLVDADTLLLADDAGALTRVRLADDGDDVMVLRAPEAQPKLALVAATSGQLALYDRARTVLVTCGEFLDDCRDRVTDPVLLQSFKPHAYYDPSVRIGEVKFAADGRRLAISHRYGVFAQDPTSASTTTLAAPPDPHRNLVGVRRDGAALVVVGERGLAIWDTRTNERRLVRDRRGFLGFSPDGELAAIRADEPPRVEIAALAGGEPRMLLVGDMHPHLVRFSPDSRRVAIAAGERVGVWDATTGAELWSELRPERVRSLEFTVRDELVYSTGEALAIRDAAGDGAPRLLQRREDGFHRFSVSPSGADLLICPNHERGASLLDLRTRRVRRKLRDVCSALFLSEDSAMTLDGNAPVVVDLRTGRRSPGALPGVSHELLLTNDRAVVGRATGESNSLVVLTREGALLATLHARGDLGWYATTPEGAIDGDPAALAELDAEVGRDLPQRYPAALVWDSVHVPGLVPRVFAGERVVPPVPR